MQLPMLAGGREKVNAVNLSWVPHVIDWDACSVAAGHKALPGLVPGAAQWLCDDKDNPCTLAFACPCGCGMAVLVTVKKGRHGSVWSWDGDLKSPTLHPSILRTEGCRWHGWLRKGVFYNA